jgi:acyl dehydratase
VSDRLVADAVAIGDELPELRRVVMREDVRAYAEVSGDRNPLHLDEDAARAAGFDGVIAHGMFTMAHMASCVVAWAGDAGSVERVSAQFRAPVPVGAEIVAGGRVRSVDPEVRTVTVESWVSMRGEQPGGEVAWPVKKGEVAVRLT